MKNRRAPARGQALVEFALLLPLMLLIVVMLFDLGRAVYYYSVLHNATREGARYGIIHPDNSAGIENAARQRAIGLDPAELTILSSRLTGGKIQVIATYQFDPATPLVSSFIGGGGLVLTAQSTMIIEE